MKTFKIFMLFAFLCVSSAWADMSLRSLPPEPPLQNPHPPTSLADHRRVDFAVAQIRAKFGSEVEIRHPHIIPWSFQRFEKNRASESEKISASPQGVIPEAAASMKIPPQPTDRPVLKADEYIVHAFVRYPGNPDWHHLDVILGETPTGLLTLRGFFDVVMPRDHQSMPPGVVC